MPHAAHPPSRQLLYYYNAQRYIQRERIIHYVWLIQDYVWFFDNMVFSTTRTRKHIEILKMQQGRNDLRRGGLDPSREFDAVCRDQYLLQSLHRRA